MRTTAEATLTGDQVNELVTYFDEDDIRTDYSGRGMWGDECLAYTGDDVFSFAARLAVLIDTGDVDGCDADGIDVLAAIDALPRPRIDDMGTGIVYYWPSIRVSDE